MEDTDKTREQLITELLDARRRIAELNESSEEKRYRLLADNAADVIWTVSIRSPNRLTYISPSVTRLTGYSVDEAMVRMMEEVFTPESLKIITQAIAEELPPGSMKQKDLTRSLTLELEFKHKSGSLVPIEVKYSFLPGPDGQPSEILAVARDISQRKQAEEALKQSLDQLHTAIERSIQTIAFMAEMRDPYTAGHQRRVTQLACAIAEELGLSKEELKTIHVAGTLHDIGKVYLPAEILSKPTRLTNTEMELIKTHPQVGSEILKRIEFPWPICPIVLQHHERIDGSGYPEGLSGGNITLGAQILAVADVVEAMSSHRPYRPALGIDKALEEISRNRGILFNSQVVDVCLRLFAEKGFKFD